MIHTRFDAPACTLSHALTHAGTHVPSHLRARAFAHTLALCAFVLVVACAGDSSRATAVMVDTLPSGVVHVTSLSPRDSAQWSVSTLHDLQTTMGTDAELVSPEDIAVSASGMVAVVDDASPRAIRLFLPSGEYAGTIGRLGAGPGEYRQARVTFAGDTLVVIDPSQERLLLFDTSHGTLLAQYGNVCCASYYPLGLDSTGSLLLSRVIAQGEMGSVAPSFARLRLDGSVLDSAWSVRKDPLAGHFMVMQGDKVLGSVPIPFWPQDRWAADAAGVLLLGSVSDYTLRTSHTGLDTVMLFSRRNAARAAVTDAEKSEWIEDRVTRDRRFVPEPLLRAAFRADEIPDQHPWFERLWVDLHGNRWVALGRRPDSPVQLDVFDRSGRWLDVVSIGAEAWPADAWAPIAFGGDRVAVVLTTDSGAPIVRVLRIRHE